MPRILYWNVNRRDLRELVCQATIASSAAAVVLLENSAGSSKTLTALQQTVSTSFHRPTAMESRFELFSRNCQLDLSEVYSGRRLTIRRLRLGAEKLLLGIVHVVDRRNWDEASQHAEVQLLASEIRDVEDREQHARSIIIGDFNMNPFDKVMNIAQGLNAMMTRKCVEPGGRTVQDRRYPFFYNPMWSHFGDRGMGPAGTFYHAVSTRGTYGWNMLDQVLIRPDAIAWFRDVEILANAGDRPLQDHRGRPCRETASDHFPVLLTLAKEKRG